MTLNIDPKIISDDELRHAVSNLLEGFCPSCNQRAGQLGGRLYCGACGKTYSVAIHVSSDMPTWPSGPDRQPHYYESGGAPRPGGWAQSEAHLDDE